MYNSFNHLTSQGHPILMNNWKNKSSFQTAEMPTAWVTCTACTYVVNKAKSYVVNNETIAHFVTMMEEVGNHGNIVTMVTTVTLLPW